MVDLINNPQANSPVSTEIQAFRRDGFVTAAGRGLITAVSLAPWAFGCRPYWAALGLAAVLLLAVASWLCGAWRERRLPGVPLLCGAAVAFLAVFAGISILNPRSTFDVVRGTFLSNPSYVPFLPGTVDVDTGWTFTLEMLAYLFVVPVVADLARSAGCRRNFLGAIAWTGLLVALAGLFLKLGGWPRLDDYLQRRPWARGGEIFGPFDYHGNAGAFLNLALPAVAWKAATSGGGPVRRMFWRCAVGILYVALFANSSRAALMIGLFLSRARDGCWASAFRRCCWWRACCWSTTMSGRCGGCGISRPNCGSPHTRV